MSNPSSSPRLTARQMEALIARRWDAFQVPRYASGLYIAFEASCKESCAACGLPCVDGGAA